MSIKHCGISKYSLSLAHSDGLPRPCCSYNKNETYKYDEIPIKWPINDDVCQWCNDKERDGIKSLRLSSRTDYVKGNLEELEISLDFTCNMSCRICSPKLSSKWAKFGKHFSDWSPRYSYSPISNYSEKIDQYIETLDFSKLKEIKFVGGEPLYSKKFKDFYPKIAHAKEIVIHTNGSVFPPSYIDKEKTLFNLSIDAIGDLASATRYGVEWDIIDDNIKRMHKEGYNIQFYSTVSILNINKIDELLEYSEQFNLCNPHRFGLVHGPKFLRSAMIPKEIRQVWNPEYSKKLSSFYDQETFYDLKEKDNFITFTDIFDANSKYSFKEINPEIYNIVKELC